MTRVRLVVAVLAAAALASAALLLNAHDTPLPEGVAARADGTDITAADVRLLAAQGKTRPLNQDAAARELIEWGWLEAEARRRHIRLSDADIAAWRKVGRRVKVPSGLLERWSRAQAIGVRLEPVFGMSKPPKIAEQKIYDLYRAHPERWSHPVKRDAYILVTRRRSAALAARAAIRRGMSWSTAVRRYSSEGDLIAAGGHFTDIIPADVENPEQRLQLFNAPVGQLVGPQRAGGEWVLLRVTKQTPALDVPYGKARPILRREMQKLIMQQYNIKALREFVDRHLPSTRCAPEMEKACKAMRSRYTA